MSETMTTMMAGLSEVLDVPAAVPPADVNPNMFAAKTICLALTRGGFGNSKKASLAAVEVEADKSLLSLSKQLLDSPELKAISKLDSEVSSFLSKLAFKSLFKGGVYLVPVALVKEITERLEDFAEQRRQLVNVAVAAYPTRVQETQARLGAVASAMDYPPIEKFKSCFRFEYQWVTFDTPTRLKEISGAIFEAERAKAEQKLTAVAEECQQAMRAGLADLVDHLAERLTPDADGKTKRLSKSTIGHLNDFLSTFELRNVTDDAQLGELVGRARLIMQGVDHKTLKADEKIAEKVAADLKALAGQLEPLIVDRGAREISFDDE